VHEECLPASPREARPLPVAAVVGRHLRPRPASSDGRRDRARHALGRRAPGARAGARRRARRPVGPRRGDDRRGPVPRRHGRHRVRARARVRRRRRHAQALRRVLGVAGGRNLAPVSSARGSSPTCCCRRSRWRCARRRALGDERVHRPRRRALRRPTATCSPASCARPGASTAPSSPTTSRSRSCSSCTAPADLGEAAAAALEAGIDVELPDRARVRRAARARRARRPRRRASSTSALRRVLGRRSSSACSTTRTAPLAAGAATGTIDLDPRGEPRARRRSPSRRSCCSTTTARCRSPRRSASP
jgi:hypothetical protein